MPVIAVTDDLSEMIQYLMRHTGRTPDRIVHDALYEAYKLEHARQGHAVQNLRDLSPWDEPAPLTEAQMDERDALERENDRLYAENPRPDEPDTDPLEDFLRVCGPGKP
jgi:hypothetical protein